MTSAPGFAEGLARLGPVSLEEIDTQAELLTRRDRKYLVPEGELGGLVARLGDRARVLDVDGQRSRLYESLYFDTPDLRSYLDAAHRRPRRAKVRIRTYLDSAVCVLEVKARDQRGRTVKHRLPYDLDRRTELTAAGRDFIEQLGGVEPGVPSPDRLRPTLTTRYRRSTLLIDATRSRVTIDLGVECEHPDGRTVGVPGLAMIETKSPNHATVVDRALWAGGRRPLKISKYCVGLAALHPDLPANKWHRVLVSHFGRAR